MNYYEYRQFVMETEIGSLSEYPKKLHAIMGMNGEAGECVDILKKHIFQGHDFNVNHLLNELGDVCWYTMLLMIDLDIEPKCIFEQVNRLLHRDDVIDKPSYLGIKYILDLNRDCGSIVNICYDNQSTPGPLMFEPLRNIFYNISMVANVFDRTLYDIFDINYRKVKCRYPSGFDSKLSINRAMTDVKSDAKNKNIVSGPYFDINRGDICRERFDEYVKSYPKTSTNWKHFLDRYFINMVKKPNMKKRKIDESDVIDSVMYKLESNLSQIDKKLDELQNRGDIIE